MVNDPRTEEIRGRLAAARPVQLFTGTSTPGLYLDADSVAYLLGRIEALEEESEEYDRILTRQGELLTGVANALNGPPPELTSWSHHDLPQKAQLAMDVANATREYVECVGGDDGCDPEKWTHKFNVMLVAVNKLDDVLGRDRDDG